MARIPRCCGCGVGLRLQLRFDLGTSICCRGGPKKGKKTKKKKFLPGARDKLRSQVSRTCGQRSCFDPALTVDRNEGYFPESVKESNTIRHVTGPGKGQTLYK